MDGEVVTIAENFVKKKGVLGPIQDFAGPFELSVSRNSIMVHYCACKNMDDFNLFLNALGRARELWNTLK